MCSGRAVQGTKQNWRRNSKREHVVCWAGIEATNGSDDVDENEITGERSSQKGIMADDGWMGTETVRGRADGRGRKAVVVAVTSSSGSGDGR